MNKLFLKRNTYYRKIDKQATLFDEPTEEASASRHIIAIEKKIKVPIESLDFCYGSVAFKFIAQEIGAELEFEIENLEVRPEFEVLKPYFAKVLKSNHAKVEIHAEYENGKLLSQLAISKDTSMIVVSDASPISGLILIELDSERQKQLLLPKNSPPTIC